MGWSRRALSASTSDPVCQAIQMPFQIITILGRWTPSHFPQTSQNSLLYYLLTSLSSFIIALCLKYMKSLFGQVQLKKQNIDKSTNPFKTNHLILFANFHINLNSSQYAEKLIRAGAKIFNMDQNRLKKLMMCFSSDEDESIHGESAISHINQSSSQPLESHEEMDNHHNQYPSISYQATQLIAKEKMVPAYVSLNSIEQNQQTTKELPKKQEKLNYAAIWKQQSHSQSSYSNPRLAEKLRQQAKNKNKSRGRRKTQNSVEEIMEIKRFKDATVEDFIDRKEMAKQKTYDIANLKVHFPFEAYPVQITYMEKVIACLDKGQNALLQSPTGTGKTLCLLTSVLSWIHSEKKAERHRRVIYLSRTHTQLAQVIKQLKATCFRPTMSIVGSREHLCIKDQLQQLKGREKMEACSKGVQIKLKSDRGEMNWEKMDPEEAKKLREAMCTFHSDRTETVLKGTQYYNNKILDIEYFKNEGLTRNFCPYYYPLHMDQYCDMFIMPYNYILDCDLLSRFANMINGSVLIFDEAHNVAEAACEGRSYELNQSNIKGAELELVKIMFNPHASSQMKEIRRHKAQSLNEIEKFIKDLIATTGDYLNRIPFEDAPIQKDKLYLNIDDKIRTKVVDSKNINEALYELINGGFTSHANKSKFQERGDYYKHEVLKLGAYTQKIGDYVDNLIDCLKETSDGIFHNMEKVVVFCRKVAGLLVKSLSNPTFIDNQINHFRLQIKGQLDQYEKLKDFTLELRCLVPWLTFSNIIHYSPRSIIFTSGTMAPLNFWENELSIKAPVRLENKHVISDSQVKLNILKKGISGKPFNFGYQFIKNDSDAIYKDLVLTLLELAKNIPNGMLVVCPNFKTLNSIKWAISQNRLEFKFRDVKTLVFEERSNQNYIDRFKEQSKKGAILFCVCRGKASEGIDFPDHTCRAVVFVGVPYPNIKDPIIMQRKQHFTKLNQANQTNLVGNDSQYTQLSWNQWYFNGTIRAINQGLGRLIRHVRDYGQLFLMDERYTEMKFRKGLPSWATTKDLDVWETFEMQKIPAIDKFYRDNKAMFPQQLKQGTSNVNSKSLEKEKQKSKKGRFTNNKGSLYDFFNKQNKK